LADFGGGQFQCDGRSRHAQLLGCGPYSAAGQSR
jgi:hypothetical protein